MSTTSMFRCVLRSIRYHPHSIDRIFRISATTRTTSAHPNGHSAMALSTHPRSSATRSDLSGRIGTRTETHNPLWKASPWRKVRSSRPDPPLATRGRLLRMGMGSGDPRTRLTTTKREAHRHRLNRVAADGAILPTSTTRFPSQETQRRRRKRRKTDGPGQKTRMLHLLRRRRRSPEVAQQMATLARCIHKGADPPNWRFQRILLERITGQGMKIRRRQVVKYGQQKTYSIMSSKGCGSCYIFHPRISCSCIY